MKCLKYFAAFALLTLFLSVTLTAQNDYRVSAPYTFKNLTIFLIHGKDDTSKKNIVTLQEALKMGIFKVYETSEVNELMVENISKTYDVFIQSGDIGADRLQEAVIDTLHEAGSDDIHTVEDGRISTVVADELSPERLTGDAELFSRPLALSNLWHGRRAADARADVRVRLRPINPTVLDGTEFSRIKRTFASGTARKTTHGRTIELSLSATGTATVNGPVTDYGGSSARPAGAVVFSVTPWRRAWGRISERSTTGVGKLRVTGGRAESELLVRVDVEAEVVAEVRHDSNLLPQGLWPASPSRRAGRRLTLPGAVVMRMTRSELVRLQERDRARKHGSDEIRLQLSHGERAEELRAEEREQCARLAQALTAEADNLRRRQHTERREARAYVDRVHRRRTVGETVTVQFARGGNRPYEVSAVVPDDMMFGGVVLPVEATAGFTVAQPVMAMIKLNDGADADAALGKVEALLADSPEVSAVSRAGYVEQQLGIFDTLLMMIQILLALAIVIAVLGIVNTLILSVMERTRELGLLRAIGLRRAQMMRMVTVEAVVVSVFGALLGIGVGAAIGAIVVQALQDEGITDLVMPWQQMGLFVGLAALVGVVAAIVPAIRAARINVLAAIAHE